VRRGEEVNMVLGNSIVRRGVSSAKSSHVSPDG